MISLQELDNLIALARLELTAEEKENLLKDISSILHFVDQIKEASADNLSVPEYSHINIMREDANAHAEEIFTEDLLAASPDREGRYIKVKKIL